MIHTDGKRTIANAPARTAQQRDDKHFRLEERVERLRSDAEARFSASVMQATTSRGGHFAYLAVYDRAFAAGIEHALRVLELD